MAIDLIHHIGIAAPADRIYHAITTEEGIRGWWTTDVKMDSKPDCKAVFGFENHSVVFQMRVEQLETPSLVRWQCESGSSTDWIGTTQSSSRNRSLTEKRWSSLPRGLDIPRGSLLTTATLFGGIYLLA